jgi:raffinose/stachyose/melibiose transport system substrate-binding protein
MVHHTFPLKGIIINKGESMKERKSAKAFKLLIAGIFAVSATIVPLTASFAAGEVRGKACQNAGETTGTSSSSLICEKNRSGSLVWRPVKLSASNLKPASALKAPRGSIEFWHWRAEDKAVFDSIIAKFEAANPGAKVTQVISNSGDYTATALQKVRGNRKAALVTTFRGAQFNQAVTADLYTDLTNEQFTKRNVIAGMLGAGRSGGKQLGIPYHSLFNNPVYNIKIFKDKGWKLPKTFNEWLAYCRTAKADGYVPMAWMGGFRPQAGQIINSALMNTAATDAQLEARITAIDTGKEEITVAWFKEMAQKYAQLRDAGCFPNNPKGVTEAAANAIFANGESPILPTGSFSMGGIKALNANMKGNMGLTGFNWTNDRNARYTAITNNTFILGINKTAGSTEQRIARAFLSFLLTGPIATEYANGTTQHVTVLDVTYTDEDLRNTSTITAERLVLAPRFIFLNQGVRDILEDALINIVGGESVDKALEDGAKLIKQRF